MNFRIMRAEPNRRLIQVGYRNSVEEAQALADTIFAEAARSGRPTTLIVADGMGEEIYHLIP